MGRPFKFVEAFGSILPLNSNIFGSGPHEKQFHGWARFDLGFPTFHSLDPNLIRESSFFHHSLEPHPGITKAGSWASQWRIGPDLVWSGYG